MIPRSTAVRVGLLAALLVVLLIIPPLWRTGWERAAKPHVVLITVDTLRADHCSSYGYHLRTTSTMDALADGGFLFERAYTPTPTTGPAHASLLTSQYPPSHGVLKNGHVLISDRVTLSEVLADQGYQTGAFVSSFVLDHRFGYDQGFETFDDDFRGADSSYKNTHRWEGFEVDGGFDRRANETTSRAIAWLEGHFDRGPVFLWVHYFDPHHPFDPPERHRSRYVDGSMAPPDLQKAIGLYDAEVEFTDYEIGRLLGAIDSLIPPERTLVILTADHGEGLMSHGFMGHGPILHEETVRVPMIFRWTGHLPAGRTGAEPVSLLDVAPTILGLLGVPAAGLPYQGEDLSGVLRGGETAAVDRKLFFFRRHYESTRVETYDVEGVVFGGPVDVKGSKQAIVEGQWKWIEAPEEGTRELYDLRSDPGETRNLYKGHPRVAEKLNRMLSEWMRAQGDFALQHHQGLSEEVIRKLEALGYVP